MSSSSKFFVLNNIKLPPDASFKEAFSVASKKLASIGLNVKEFNFRIYKRSTDARNKSDIKLVYSVLASGESGNIPDSVLKRIDATQIIDSDKDHTE